MAEVQLTSDVDVRLPFDTFYACPRWTTDDSITLTVTTTTLDTSDKIQMQTYPMADVDDFNMSTLLTGSQCMYQ